MSARWTAGAVRARAIARRRAGADAARGCAAASGLPEALRMLDGTTYGRRLHQDMDLRTAEHAVESTLLWNLRVLAGWQPRAGADLLRVAVSGYEAADIIAHLRELGGRQVGGRQAGTPYELGALATVWPRVRRAATPAQVRAALAGSPWGDPGAEDPAAVAFYLRLSSALRLAVLGSEARAMGSRGRGGFRRPRGVPGAPPYRRNSGPSGDEAPRLRCTAGVIVGGVRPATTSERTLGRGRGVLPGRTVARRGHMPAA